MLEALRTPAPAEVLAKYRQLKEGGVAADGAPACDAQMGSADEDPTDEAEGEKTTPADQSGALKLRVGVTLMVDYALVDVKTIGEVSIIMGTKDSKTGCSIQRMIDQPLNGEGCPPTHPPTQNLTEMYDLRLGRCGG